MLKNGAASVISSSDTVGGGGAFIRGGRLNKGAFIDGFYLRGVQSRGRLFKALQ